MIHVKAIGYHQLYIYDSAHEPVTGAITIIEYRLAIYL